MTAIVSLDCTGAQSTTGGYISANLGDLVSSLSFLSIPEGVETISNDALSGATSLATVILPTTVTLISKDAFPSDLETIVFTRTTPPTMDPKAFSNTPPNIIVPKGAETAYENALNSAGMSGTITTKSATVTSITTDQTTLSSAGGTVKAKIIGTDLLAQTIKVLRGGTAEFLAEIVSDTEASADVVIPANTGTAVVSHTLTVFLNGSLVTGSNASATVLVSPDETPPGDGYRPITGVTLDKTTLSLTKGSELTTLTATLAPSNTTSEDVAVTWTTDKSSVATVTATGANTGITRTAAVVPVAAGTATITITAAGKTAVCLVTVTEGTTPADPTLPTSISFVSPTQTVQVGQTATVAWNILPVGATSTVTLTSSNPAIAVVSPSSTTGATATVTGLAAGTATITVRTVNGHSAACYVYVTGGATATGVISRVTLNQNAPYTAGDPFDIVVGLTSVPASVRVDILRPDWYVDSFTARMEGLSAWITYTPWQEGTYTVTATALNSAGAVIGTGTISFVVTGGRSGGSGGGCSAARMGLLALLLVPAVKRIKKSR
jgi:uncharacterized protein YjdB